MVSAINDNRIGARYINTRFDNCSTNQDIKALVIEVTHNTFKVTLAHLAMCDGHTCFWHQRFDVAGCFLNRVDIVVQEVNLSTA